MARFVSAPTKPPWAIVVKCGSCRYRYAYDANDIVKGEDCRDLSLPSVYCGNCTHVIFITPNRIPRRVLANAKQY